MSNQKFLIVLVVIALCLTMVGGIDLYNRASSQANPILLEGPSSLDDFLLLNPAFRVSEGGDPKLSSLDYSTISIDVDISGARITDEVLNGTQIWIGNREDNQETSQEVLLFNATTQHEAVIKPGPGLKAAWDAYTLDFVSEQFPPSPDNVWYLRIENLISGSQKHQEWLSTQANDSEEYSQPGGWLRQFRLRFGSTSAFRSLLHPYVTYGTNCTVELQGHQREFVKLQATSIPSESNRHNKSLSLLDWDSDHEEVGSKVLGAALVVGCKEYEHSGFDDLPEIAREAGVVVHALQQTGQYQIFYNIEGPGQYSTGTYPSLKIDDGDVEDGLGELDLQTYSSYPYAIVSLHGHGGKKDDHGNAARAFTTSKKKNNGLPWPFNEKWWVNVLKQGELEDHLEWISDNGNVNTFTWLAGCDGQDFKYIVEDQHVSNAIMWWYQGTRSLSIYFPLTPSQGFGTNLNYAFYSVEELFGESCTYTHAPRWHAGDVLGSVDWGSPTVSSVSVLEYGDTDMRMADNYPGELYLNPHTSQFTDGCWSAGTGPLTEDSGSYTAQLTQPRYIKVQEVNTYIRYVGVKYTFVKDWRTSLHVRFNVRATSNYAGSSVTNFFVRLYNGTGHYVTGSTQAVYYLVGTTDTGWAVISKEWPDSTFGYYAETYTLIFFYSDAWWTAWQQTIYVSDTLAVYEGVG